MELVIFMLTYFNESSLCRSMMSCEMTSSSMKLGCEVEYLHEEEDKSIHQKSTLNEDPMSVNKKSAIQTKFLSRGRAGDQ